MYFLGVFVPLLKKWGATHFNMKYELHGSHYLEGHPALSETLNSLSRIHVSVGDSEQGFQVFECISLQW